MIQQLRRTGSLVIVGVLFAAGCSGPVANIAPTAAIAPTNAPTTPPTAQANPTIAPAATAAPAQTAAPAATPAPEPVATGQPLPSAAGELVLKLGAGNAGDQVGIAGDGPNSIGPRSFRIGADGSIRVLDNVNKRVLFFDQGGKLTRAFPIAEAQDPHDFIVNNAGEVFVFDQGASQVLRYGPKGNVTATLALSPGVSASADGIMLTSAQDLMLVQNNQSFWVLFHQGVTVPPELQPLTMRTGTVTPRSPMVFQTTLAASDAPFLHIVGLRSGGTNDMVADVDGREVQLPSDAQFFNVDRAMNLYFMRTSPDADAFDVWRVNPDGSAAGGAHIATGACGISWRSLYVDQAGAAWTMCVSASGAAIMRYPLLAPDGTPLPAAAQDAADVAWRPGARLDAA